MRPSNMYAAATASEVPDKNRPSALKYKGKRPMKSKVNCLLLACIAGTGGIILVAPSLYDTRQPLDALVSKVINLHHGTYIRW